MWLSEILENIVFPPQKSKNLEVSIDKVPFVGKVRGFLPEGQIILIGIQKRTHNVKKNNQGLQKI